MTRRCEHVSGLYSEAETDLRFEDVLDDPEIEGVVIATPVSTHYPMAKRALDGGQVGAGREAAGDVDRSRPPTWCGPRARTTAC